MKIDRRITNGLAWTGALLVVAIPTADFITRQFMPDVGSSVAVVSEVRAPVVEASSAPVAVSAPQKVAEAPKAVEAPKPTVPVAAVAANSPAKSDDPVDSFLQSGRALPDYITGGGAAPAAKPAAAPEKKPEVQAAPKPVEPAPAPVEKPALAAPLTTPEPVASVPKVVGFPTPLSQRPPSVAVANTPPLIIDTPPIHTQTVIRPSENRVIRPEELDGWDEWEAGPVQDFLSQQGSRAVVRREQVVPPNVVVPPSAIVPPANVGRGNDYVPGGFFFDQGPANAQPRRFPPAYDDSGFPEYEIIPLN